MISHIINLYSGECTSQEISLHTGHVGGNLPGQMDRDIAASPSRPGSKPFESPVLISFLFTMRKNDSPSKLMVTVDAPCHRGRCNSVLNAEKEICYEETELDS